MIACIAEAWKVSLVNPILSWHVLLSGRTGTLEHRNTQKTRNTTYNPEHPPENPEYPQKTRNTPQKTRNTPQKMRNIFQNTKKSAKSLKPDRASMLQNKFLLRGTRMKLWVLKNVRFKCQISMGVPGFLGGVSGFLGVFWVFLGGCSRFSHGCSGFFGCSRMFRCSGVPGSTTFPLSCTRYTSYDIVNSLTSWL